MRTTDLPHRLRVWVDMVRSGAAHPKYTIELLNEAADMIDLINRQGVFVKREDVEKKLAFEYRYGNLCGHCEHWRGYVCAIANKYTYFDHECDVEEPEPEKCE